MARRRRTSPTIEGHPYAEVEAFVELRVGTRNEALLFQDEGSPVASKGDFGTINFTGVGVAAAEGAVGTLDVTVRGGGISAYIAKTANYIVTSADTTINCTSGSFTVTLLTAVGITGQIFNIKNTGTGLITIATTSSQTIDGQAGSTIQLLRYESITVQSDGANWVIL